jgi:hypothetical protein
MTGGCTGISRDNEVHSYLDESTGTTVTALLEPLVFFREAPALAANARDYVYLGPAELNRAGKYETVLWLNFCSTIDRNPQRESYRPDRVFLLIDESPMELAEPDHRSNAIEWTYVAPVSGGTPLIYRITRSQLQLLAKSSDIRLLAQVDGNDSRTYARWGRDRSGLRRFSAYLDDGAKYIMTSTDER